MIREKRGLLWKTDGNLSARLCILETVLRIKGKEKRENVVKYGV